MSGFRADIQTITQTGKGRYPQSVTPALLMLKTGWTYEELLNQPASIIEDILIIMEAEAIASKVK